MQVIPAIDLRGGRCVRLRQGDFEQETIFGDDPTIGQKFKNLIQSYAGGTTHDLHSSIDTMMTFFFEEHDLYAKGFTYRIHKGLLETQIVLVSPTGLCLNITYSSVARPSRAACAREY